MTNTMTNTYVVIFLSTSIFVRGYHSRYQNFDFTEINKPFRTLSKERNCYRIFFTCFRVFSRSVSGSLFKEILKFDEEDTILGQPDISFPVVPCDDDIDLLYESRSSVGSESDDPIRDETLLQDLFYVAKVCPLSTFLLTSLIS